MHVTSLWRTVSGRPVFHKCCALCRELGLICACRCKKDPEVKRIEVQAYHRACL